MKSKIKHIVIIIFNAVVITAICILTIVGNSMAVSQRYNYTADTWKNNNKENFAQISTFFAENSGFTTDLLNSVRAELIKELRNISIETDGKNLPFAEAYSTQAGTFKIKGDLTGSSEAVLTAVGGDFFVFRNFHLINGSYFNDGDLMQDGAVIDRSLAWELYGSSDVAGMNLYIDGVKFYISGVIENPETKPEKNCVGKLPRIYISYDGASHLSSLTDNSKTLISPDTLPTVNTGLRNITCYETILPNPVENFAYNTVKKQFSENYKDKCSIVKNSTRFEPSVRSKAFRKIADYAVIKNNINYPYWENASRIVEFKLTFLYFFRKILFVVPALTALWLVILAVMFLKRKKPAVLRAISIFIDRRRRDIKEKIFKKQEKV
ncbi:MAG: ABC transporter permease [Ruminococcus sp.]|nr:ABC transporter permease [Ruminococcus sp.]